MIHDYQIKILQAAELFEKYKGVTKSKLSRARFEGLPSSGFLDPKETIEYYFHGIGLCVTFPDHIVDWDFGYDGRLNGFDLWRLWVFATEGNNNYPEFKQKEVLEKAFVEAENQGIFQRLFKNFKDDLFYLTNSEKES